MSNRTRDPNGTLGDLGQWRLPTPIRSEARANADLAAGADHARNVARYGFKAAAMIVKQANRKGN